MNILAIIPARGGSKRIPNKNLKQLGHHPLIAYSVAAALQSQCVSRVIVSTDSEDIAETSRQYGADVPFMRPDAISGDTATDWEAFQHALAWLDENEQYRPEMIVHLRPTSPYRAPELVDHAVKLLHDNPEGDSVRSLIVSEETPYKMWQPNEAGFVQPVLTLPDIPEAHNMPSLRLPVTYLHSGHIDVMRWSVIMDMQSMTGKNIVPLYMDDDYSIDIDLPSDWQHAERLFNTLEKPYVIPNGPSK